jgi:predicted metal-binding membrane protein
MWALQPSALGKDAARATARLGAIGSRPTLWVEVALVLAWVGLALGSGETRVGGGPGGAASSGSLWVCTLPGFGGASSGVGGAETAAAAAAVSQAAAFAAGLPMWALMAAAMMLPTAMPAVRHVTVRSLYWRRRRAAVEFIAIYVAIWAVFSALVLGMAVPLTPLSPSLALPIGLAIAALWQLTPLKRRALRACHKPAPLPPSGWRATAGVTRFGLGNGAACLVSCWAMMLTMAAVGSARLVWMAALAALISAEKLSLKPARASRRVAALLGTAAIAAAAVAV